MRIWWPSGGLSYAVGSHVTGHASPAMRCRPVVRFHLFHHPGEDYTPLILPCQIHHAISVSPQIWLETSLKKRGCSCACGYDIPCRQKQLAQQTEAWYTLVHFRSMLCSHGCHPSDIARARTRTQWITPRASKPVEHAGGGQSRSGNPCVITGTCAPESWTRSRLR